MFFIFFILRNLVLYHAYPECHMIAACEPHGYVYNMSVGIIQTLKTKQKTNIKF